MEIAQIYEGQTHLRVCRMTVAIECCRLFTTSAASCMNPDFFTVKATSPMETVNGTLTIDDEDYDGGFLPSKDG